MISQKVENKRVLVKRESYYTLEDARKAEKAYHKQHIIGQINLKYTFIETQSKKQHTLVIGYYDFR